MHLQENTLFDLDLEVKVTRNVAQYPLHHVTYAATKFEVARSKGLGGDTFTRIVMGGKKKAGIMRQLQQTPSEDIFAVYSGSS